MKISHSIIIGALSGSGSSNQGNKAAQALQKAQSNQQTFKRMSDVARWIHQKMISNPGSPDGQKLIKLDQKFKDKMLESSPGPGAPLNNTFGLATGMSADDLAAENEAILALSDFYLHWIKMVKSHGPWDFKNHAPPKGIKSSKTWEYDAVSKLFYRNDLWGNVHYGFVGRAVGFSRQMLRQGAGGAQLVSDLTHGRFSNIGDSIVRLISNYDGFASYDPPGDTRSVELGVELYDKFKLNLTFNQFLSEVRRNANRLPTRK